MSFGLRMTWHTQTHREGNCTIHWALCSHRLSILNIRWHKLQSVCFCSLAMRERDVVSRVSERIRYVLDILLHRKWKQPYFCNNNGTMEWRFGSREALRWLFVFSSEKVTPTIAMNLIRKIFLRRIWNYNMRAQWMAINKAQLRKKKKKLLLLHGKCTHDSLWHEHLCTRRTINRIVCCGECGRVCVREVFAIVFGHVKETPPCCSLLTARRTYVCVRPV